MAKICKSHVMEINSKIPVSTYSSFITVDSA
jgi:hypothetical protein